MITLIHLEYKKIRKTRAFIISCLAALILPFLGLVVFSLYPLIMISGDFMRLNLTLVTLIVARLCFPVLGMILIKTGDGFQSIKSSFLSPIRRELLLISKIILVAIWMIFLMTIMISVNMMLEWIIFRNTAIWEILVSQLSSYAMVLAYAVPVQIVAMLFTLLLEQVFTPMLILYTTSFVGYIIQLEIGVTWLPSYIGKMIITDEPIKMSAFIFLYTLGSIGFYLLMYQLKHRDFIR